MNLWALARLLVLPYTQLRNDRQMNCYFSPENSIYTYKLCSNSFSCLFTPHPRPLSPLSPSLFLSLSLTHTHTHTHTDTSLSFNISTKLALLLL